MNKFLVTMQFEEEFLLPIFLKHYSQFFDPKNIYIIDHGSPNSFDHLYQTGFNKIYLPRNKPFSEKARLNLISSIVKGLLEYYDYGVYADCDELIDLNSFDENDFMSSPVIWTAGFDVATVTDGVEQKLIGKFNPSECKPLIFKTLPEWRIGFHGCEFAPTVLKVPMIHTKFLDKERAANRLLKRIEIYSEMHGVERGGGVNAHWESGTVSLEKFYEEVSTNFASSKVCNFKPITDITNIFRASSSGNLAYIKHTPYYDSDPDKHLFKDEWWDLSQFFQKLL